MSARRARSRTIRFAWWSLSDAPRFELAPFSTESQLRLLQSVSDWSRHLMRLAILAEGVERPTVDQLGELAWLRAFDNEDLQEFVSDMKQCLVAARADGDARVLEDCLNHWRTTAKQLEDPLRRSVLLGEHQPSDFIAAPRPVDEGQPYDPLCPAPRSGGKPDGPPKYRVLVHKRFRRQYEELVTRVGLQQAQQFWDHVTHDPGNPAPVASTCILKGKARHPQGPGWSRTVHYELTGAARVDYQHCDEYRTRSNADAHPPILTINYSSH